MKCLFCEEPIHVGERLHPYLIGSKDGPQAAHVECMFRQIAGGANHIAKACTCCGGTLPPDPAHLNKRQAALAAWEMRHLVPGWSNEPCTTN